MCKLSPQKRKKFKRQREFSLRKCRECGKLIGLGSERMIAFAPISLQQRQQYLPYLQAASHRGCAYSFVNQYLWGRQQAAIVEGMLVIFSQYNCKSV